MTAKRTREENNKPKHPEAIKLKVGCHIQVFVAFSSSSRPLTRASMAWLDWVYHYFHSTDEWTHSRGKCYDAWRWIPTALMLLEVSCCFKAERTVTCAVEITKACQQGCSSCTGLLRSWVALSSGTQHSASFFLMVTQIKALLTLSGSCSSRACKTFC